jgi:hypothetical protein
MQRHTSGLLTYAMIWVLAIPTFAANVRDLPRCGDIYAPPFANPADAGRRSCPTAVPRTYHPRHDGLGYEILRLESDACFVPDEFFQLLDQLVDEGSSRAKRPRELAFQRAQLLTLA